MSTHARRTSTLGLFFCLAALLCVSAQEVAAQAESLRPDGTYLRPRLGLSAYGGDRNPSGALQGPGPSTGIEFGTRRRLGPLGGGLGLLYVLGRYPRIVRDVPEALKADGSALEDELAVWRHTVGAVGRTGFAPEARVNPYLQLGLGTTVTFIGGQFDFAFAPLGGAGADVAITDQVGLFFEVTAILGLPDRATDQAEGIDGGPLDGLGFYGGGVRINLSDPAIPPAVIALDGPTRLEAGEPATFAATVNDETVTDPVEYRWDFGDGAAGAGLEATHRFDEPGNYTLTFTARNEEGADEQLLTVAVVEPPPPPPTITLSEPDSAEAGQPVRLAADVQGEGPVRTAWDFGDGATASGAEATHVYEEPGTYTATLEASGAGGTSTESVTVRVRQPAVAALSCDDVVELNAAFFEKDAATLREDGRQALQENLALLNACPELDVRLEGLAAPDERDPETLAAARADVVADVYVTGGISPDRIRRPAPLAQTSTSTKSGLSLLRRTDSVPVPASAAASDALTDAEN